MYKNMAFYHFARKFGNKYDKKIRGTAVNTKSKYGKQIMNITKKQSINFAKTSAKKNT